MRKKQLIILIIILAAAVALIFGVKAYKNAQEEKQAAQEEAETVYVNQFDVSDVTAFAYMLDDTLVMFDLQDGTWVYYGDTTMEIDADKIEELLTTMSNMTANTVIEDVEDTSEYGINNAVQMFSAVFSDGSSLTYLFGSENEIVGGHYVQVTSDADDVSEADNKKVYLVDSSYVTSTLATSLENLQVSDDAGSVSE